jgi:putative DNA methylase
VPLIDRRFDVQLANALVQREVHNKHLARPNSYLHKWWARRCGTTFRLLLKHLAEEPTGYYDGGGLEGKIILDPMMGGGTTLHEAIRLGANVVGCDVEPIPVLQARAALTRIPLKSIENHFRELRQAIEQDISPYFMTWCRRSHQEVPLRYLLYGARRSCACRTVIMVDSFLLRQDRHGRLVLCPQCRDVHLFGGACSPARYGDARLPALISRRQKVCPDCGGAFSLARDVPFYDR